MSKRSYLLAFILPVAILVTLFFVPYMFETPGKSGAISLNGWLFNTSTDLGYRLFFVPEKSYWEHHGRVLTETELKRITGLDSVYPTNTAISHEFSEIKKIVEEQVAKDTYDINASMLTDEQIESSCRNREGDVPMPPSIPQCINMLKEERVRQERTLNCLKDLDIGNSLVFGYAYKSYPVLVYVPVYSSSSKLYKGFYVVNDEYAIVYISQVCENEWPMPDDTEARKVLSEYLSDDQVNAQIIESFLCMFAIKSE